MHYSVELEVPADTPVLTPVTAPLELPVGFLRHTTIVFPPGCSRMVLVCILEGATQLFPRNSDLKYAEDGYHFEIDEFYRMDTAKTLTVSASSAGTAYKHVISIHYEVVTQEDLAMERSGYY